jgi:hypothetical protein
MIRLPLAETTQFRATGRISVPVSELNRNKYASVYTMIQDR